MASAMGMAAPPRQSWWEMRSGSAVLCGASLRVATYAWSAVQIAFYIAFPISVLLTGVGVESVVLAVVCALYDLAAVNACVKAARCEDSEAEGARAANRRAAVWVAVCTSAQPPAPRPPDGSHVSLLWRAGAANVLGNVVLNVVVFTVYIVRMLGGTATFLKALPHLIVFLECLWTAAILMSFSRERRRYATGVFTAEQFGDDRA